MSERELLVRIVGDDRDLQRSLTSSTRAVKKFDKDVAKVSGRTTALGQGARGALSVSGGKGGFLFGSGTFIGSALVTGAIVKSVSAASDLNEQIAKSRQVFGDSSRAIEDWSSTTAHSFGISKTAALEASGTFGNLFSTVDLLPSAAAEMSRALVELAGDLASFNNARTDEVLIALRSGLIGEAEPLRRFGVLLSEAAVQQLALADTGKKSAKELTNQEKVLARYKIILRDTEKAQGDFARTSTGLANQTRILKANIADAAAEFGKNLAPAVGLAVRGLNELFELGGKLHIDPDINLDSLIATRGEIASLRGETDLLVVALDRAIERLSQLRAGPAEASRGEGRTAESIVQSNLGVDARKAEEEAKKAAAAVARSRRAFAALTEGLGLKFDKAGLTKGLDDDIAALEELERAIQRQIRREGKTFELVDQLTQVRRQIMDTVASRAQQQAQRTRDATQRIIDARRDEVEALKELAQQQRELRQGRQFEALGLTAEGDKRTPGAGALLRRTRGLQDQVKGTVLDTGKTRTQLQRVAALLKKDFNKVGKDVRAVILQMLNDISDALKGKGSKQGPLTKTTSLNSKKLLAGIGLSPEEIRELRGRLSSFNSAGLAPAGATPGTRTTGGFTGGTGIVVENNVTVAIDGQKFSAVVTKQQQKTKRRNPKQKRGPNRNR